MAYYRKPDSSPTKVTSRPTNIHSGLLIERVFAQTVNSLLTLKLDQSNKVTHHQEEWDHKRETTSDDGFFGMLNEERKKITANITAKVMGK